MLKHRLKKFAGKKISKNYLLKIFCALFLLILAVTIFLNGLNMQNTRLVYSEKANPGKNSIISANTNARNFNETASGQQEKAFVGETAAATIAPSAKPTAKPVKLSPTKAVPTPTIKIQPTSPPIANGKCPVTTQNCVPCNAGELYCRTEPGNPTGYKGWACQNNNPGNIRYSSYRISLITGQGGAAPCGFKPQTDGYMVFTDYNSGYNGLKAYIKAINAGQHTSYPACGNCNLQYFFQRYAPADYINYANIVASAIGVSPDSTPLNWIVANKLDAFASAIKTHEGWFTY